MKPRRGREITGWIALAAGLLLALQIIILQVLPEGSPVEPWFGIAFYSGLLYRLLGLFSLVGLWLTLRENRWSALFLAPLAVYVTQAVLENVHDTTAYWLPQLQVSSLLEAAPALVVGFAVLMTELAPRWLGWLAMADGAGIVIREGTALVALNTNLARLRGYLEVQRLFLFPLARVDLLLTAVFFAVLGGYLLWPSLLRSDPETPAELEGRRQLA